MSSAAHSNRRWRRYRRRLKVTLRQGPSYSVDLGLGGVSLELLRVLPPGSPVEGTIHDPGFEVRFSGAVVWAKPGDPHMGLRGRMGIRFTSLAAPANAPPWLAPEADSRAGGP